MPAVNPEKARKARLRRAAGRRGLVLYKARVRDPRVWWRGTYGLADANTTALVAGDHNTGYGLDLDDVEGILAER